MLSRRLPTLLLVVLALILSARTGRAQTANGAISGTVKTSSDAVLGGATVRVRNETLGLERTVVSDESGVYTATNLPLVGAYEVTVDFSGFASVVQSGVSLLANPTVTLDIVMQAASAETLVVSGRVTTVRDPERSVLRQTVSDTLVHSLPIEGRDFISLTQLTPGFTGNPNYPNALGQQYWSNNVIVDGGSHYSKWRGAARTHYSGYPLEAIKEVSVLTSQYSAEYGESLASVTSAITNSGTNTTHGSALLFAQTTVFNDIPAFTPSRPPYGHQKFGATIGGPVVRDRTHYFLSYEGLRERGHRVVTSPVASGSLTTNNQDEHLFFAKLDHKTSDHDLLSLRYDGQRFRWRDEQGGLTLAGNGTQTLDDVHTALGSYTRLISETTLNQLRVQFARYNTLQTDVNPQVWVARNGYSYTGGVVGPVGLGAMPEDTVEATNTLSTRLASHMLKVGGGVKHVVAHNESIPTGFGAYLYAGAPAQFPNPYLFTQGIAATPEAGIAEPKSVSLSLFAQDSWQLGPTVTVDAGVRYDLESIRDIDGFDAPADKNNLQPRLGVAWELMPGTTFVRGGVGFYNQQHLLYYINRVQLEGPSGVAVVNIGPFSPLFPTYPAVLTSEALSRLPRDVQRLAPDFRNPYSMQATAGIERRLDRGLVFSADYVYLRGYDLMSLVDVNAPQSISKATTRSVPQADATRPITPTPGGYRKIIELGNQGESWYKALQVKANKTTGRLQLAGAYTYGHADDLANYLLPEDSRDLAAEKGRADADIRHNVSVGFTWQLPATTRLLPGVVVSGVGQYRSGRPYTQTWGDDRFGTTQRNARPGARNTLETADYRNIDLSLARQFRVGRNAIEGRIEAFNVLSTVNYDQYEGSLSSPLYAQPLSAFARRRIQFAATIRF